MLAATCSPRAWLEGFTLPVNWCQKGWSLPSSAVAGLLSVPCPWFAGCWADGADSLGSACGQCSALTTSRAICGGFLTSRCVHFLLDQWIEQNRPGCCLCCEGSNGQWWESRISPSRCTWSHQIMFEHPAAVLPAYCLSWMCLQMETAELLYGYCWVLHFKMQPQIAVWL